MTHNPTKQDKMGSRNPADAFQLTGRDTRGWRALEDAQRQKSRHRLTTIMCTPSLRGGGAREAPRQGNPLASPPDGAGLPEEIRARTCAGEAESPTYHFRNLLRPPSQGGGFTK